MIIHVDSFTFFREERVTDNVGNWYSILEYAQVKNVSISTIRRGIKSGRLKHKIEDGKYFIFTTKILTQAKAQHEEFLLNENKLLRERVRKLAQELDEYKMLVDLYENGQMIKHPSLPQIPEISQLV